MTKLANLKCQTRHFSLSKEERLTIFGRDTPCMLDLPADGEEPVHVVHGEAEDLRLAAQLLADLQHPVGHDLPHVGHHLHLHRPEVVGRRRKIPGN